MVGATPHLAEVVLDRQGVLTELTDESISKFAEQVSEEIRFGSNVRSGAAYRKAVCQVLVKRTLKTMKGEQI